MPLRAPSIDPRFDPNNPIRQIADVFVAVTKNTFELHVHHEMGSYLRLEINQGLNICKNK